MLTDALTYVELGYHVLPCAPGRKVPLTPRGVLDASGDPKQMEAWWAREPQANIGVSTTGLLVLDIDGDANPWLNDRRLADSLARTPSAVTPGGGRHYFFRQPAGRRWRNTAGKLAPRVDTRATGGYVLVAPSVVDGRPYRWINDPPPFDQLAEPPDWLMSALDTIGVKDEPHEAHDDATDAIIPSGRRNDSLARLAGAMRRVGMTAAEICAALRQVNADRCRPPLPPGEVDRIATSIARYEPAEQPGQRIPRPVSAAALVGSHTRLRPAVIEGLLRRGETMNVIAPPKTGKSWLVLGLTIAVATGRRWLDTFATATGRALILDNELHIETLAHRIPKVTDEMGVSVADLGDSVEVQSLRGQLRDIFSLRDYFEAIDPGRYSIIVLDAFYRFMPVGMDENDNGTMAGVYNFIDSIADKLRCSFVLIHHTTKGNQSAKSVTDVGAGAGSQSRAADTHLVLRAHQEPDVVVLDAVARSWPPVPSRCLRWTFPTWTPADELDPAELRSERPGRAAGNAMNVTEFVAAAITDTPATVATIRAAVPRLSGRRVAALLEAAVAGGLAHRWRVGRSHQVLYATGPQPERAEK